MKTKLIFLYCAALGIYSLTTKAQDPETIIQIVKDAYAGNYYTNTSDDYEYQPRTSSSRKSTVYHSSPRHYSESCYYAGGDEDPERIIQIVKNAYAGDYNYARDYDNTTYTYRRPVAGAPQYVPQQNYNKSFYSENTSKQERLDLSLQTPKLTQIPDYVFGMRGLKILDVSYNRIGFISKQILNLSQLEILILSGNQYLHELPDFLGEMKNLRTVYLQGMGTWNEQKKYATIDRFKSKGIMVVID